VRSNATIVIASCHFMWMLCHVHLCQAGLCRGLCEGRILVPNMLFMISIYISQHGIFSTTCEQYTNVVQGNTDWER
jgi:hypothetical protein